MRKLIIIRGCPGIGKTTLIKSLGLDSHVASMDNIRAALWGARIGQSGRLGLTQHRNRDVALLHKEQIKKRMSAGELLVIEEAFLKDSQVIHYAQLANRYGYAVAFVDWTGAPTELATARFLQREGFDKTPFDPERLAMKMQSRAKNTQSLYKSIQANCKGYDCLHFTWTDAKEQTKTKELLDSWLVFKPVDLSQYNEVVHIGDIQGCYSVVWGKGGPLERGLQKDTAYIFTGDMLDRGTENAEVFAMIRDTLINKSNVFLLCGNHDLHLLRWGKGMNIYGNEFKDVTQHQLTKAGITKADATEVMSHFLDALHYTWRGHTVIASHAGIGGVPDRLERVPSEQFTRGTRGSAARIDELFNANAPAGWEQVHGHRKQKVKPPKDGTSRSICLEDGVENGGNLCVATLSRRGWEVDKYKNSVPARVPGLHKNTRLK